MSIKFSTSGRPYVECPTCQKLHAVYRRGNYINKEIVRVVCRACGTQWNLNDDEKATLRRHYEQRQRENAEKKRQKEEKNPENLKKDEQNPEKKNRTKPPESKKEGQKHDKRKGWLEELLS